MAELRRLGSSSSSGGSSFTPEIIEYKPPGYDEQTVKAYQQEALAASMSGLRRSMREAQAGRYGSPTARSEALRGALRGYGESLAPLQESASALARGRYDIEYQQDVEAEQRRVDAEQQSAWMKYEQDLLGEAEAEKAKVIIGYNAAGFPIYGTQAEYDARQAQPTEWTGHSTTGYGGEPSTVTGLTEASLRPISDEPTYGRSLYPESAAPESAYSSNWMY
jgi:hypothetical protein